MRQKTFLKNSIKKLFLIEVKSIECLSSFFSRVSLQTGYKGNTHILPTIIYITNKTIDIPPMGNKPRKIMGYYFIVAFSIIMQRILMALFLKRTVYHYNISSEHNYLNACSCVSFFYLYLCINIIDYSYASQMCIMPINEIGFRYIDN